MQHICCVNFVFSVCFFFPEWNKQKIESKKKNLRPIWKTGSRNEMRKNSPKIYTNFESNKNGVFIRRDLIWSKWVCCWHILEFIMFLCVSFFGCVLFLFFFFHFSSALFLRLRLKYRSLFLLYGSKFRSFVSSVYLRRLIVEQVVLDRAVHSTNKTEISETKKEEKKTSKMFVRTQKSINCCDQFFLG